VHEPLYLHRTQHCPPTTQTGLEPLPLLLLPAVLNSEAREALGILGGASVLYSRGLCLSTTSLAVSISHLIAPDSSPGHSPLPCQPYPEPSVDCFLQLGLHFSLCLSQSSALPGRCLLPLAGSIFLTSLSPWAPAPIYWLAALFTAIHLEDRGCGCHCSLPLGGPRKCKLKT
jgi:hypothetical protein